MQILFENRYEVSKATLKKIITAQTFASVAWRFLLVFSAIIVVGLSLRLILGAWYQLKDLIAPGAVVCIFIISLISLLKSRINITKAYRNGRISVHTINIRVLDTGEYAISYDMNFGEEIIYKFHPINKVLSDKNFVMLQVEPTVWIPFKNDSFVVGTYGEFLNFMNATYVGFRKKHKSNNKKSVD